KPHIGRCPRAPSVSGAQAAKTSPAVRPRRCSRRGRNGRPSLRRMHALGYDAFENLFVSRRACVDEELLDALQVPRTLPPSRGRIRMQGEQGIFEGGFVVERERKARLTAAQKIGLSAAVVADDRQAERHRFEEHEAKALVLARRYEHVRGAQRGVLAFLRELS